MDIQSLKLCKKIPAAYAAIKKQHYHILRYMYYEGYPIHGIPCYDNINIIKFMYEEIECLRLQYSRLNMFDKFKIATYLLDNNIFDYLVNIDHIILKDKQKLIGENDFRLREEYRDDVNTIIIPRCVYKYDFKV